MSELEFEVEWEDPHEAKGRELRATWARLAIRVGDIPVTRLIDFRSDSLREAIYAPLYPLAEWIAWNWWSLLHEVETTGCERMKSYGRRHRLFAAREGYALPDLHIVPFGRFTELRWFSSNSRDARVRFVEQGTRLVKTSSVHDELERFVSAVVNRLETEGVVDTPLQDEWAAIQTSDPEESEFCRIAAALGTDAYSMDDASRALLITAFEQVPAELVDEFCAAIDFQGFRRERTELAASIDSISTSDHSMEPLSELRKRASLGDPRLAPWEQGYALARDLRGVLGLNGVLLAQDEALARALGCQPGLFAESMLIPPTPTWRFDALMGPGKDGHPVVVNGKYRSDSRRFAFCRALYEVLTVAQPDHWALVTRAYSDRQRANRAFAAEFLAPEALLRNRLGGAEISEEEVDEVAAEFGVSSWVIRHQITNHCIAGIVP